MDGSGSTGWLVVESGLIGCPMERSEWSGWLVERSTLVDFLKWYGLIWIPFTLLTTLVGSSTSSKP